MTTVRKLSVMVIENDGGFACRCGGCSTIILEGTWALLLVEDDRTFLVADDELFKCCCGREIERLRLFDDGDDAEKALALLAEYLRSSHSWDQVRLVECTITRADKPN